MDRAVELFWADGFGGVDVERIASAAGVGKPSLYRLFGNKSSLFLHAMGRYARTVGGPPLAAFAAEPDIAEAVWALLEGKITAATTEGRPSGCLTSSVAAAQAESSPEVRREIGNSLAMMADLLTHRFEQEVRGGRLPATTSARARSSLLIDLIQGLLLRARVGVAREELLMDVRSYVPLVLGLPTVRLRADFKKMTSSKT